ncbi:MAG: hypothetical protein M3Q58_10025 [Bacteroidota bacterium]|nr:hypothetical protein [Bacteroidota bacterium]
MENLKKLLFNPFEEIAGYKALFIGVFLIVLTGISGYFAGVVFDGVLDMHFVENKLSIAASIIEGLVNWLSLSIILIIFGFLFSKTKFRLIDVLGTQALARWPYFILAIFEWFLLMQLINTLSGNI